MTKSKPQRATKLIESKGVGWLISESFFVGGREMDDFHAMQLVSVVSPENASNSQQILEITINSASNLPKDERTGSVDTFCSIVFAESEQKTGVRKRTANPGLINR